MLMLNVPAGNGVNYQLAQNTITGAWSKFEGWDANVWLSASSGLYFGDDTAVKKAWSGNLDGTVPIQSDACSAFSYFGAKSSNKYWTMVRPYLQATGIPSVLYALNVDFTLSEPSGVLATSPVTGMVWGSMTWGSMTWGGGLTSTNRWNTVGQVANSAALRMKVQNNGGEVRWTNTDFVYQLGGVL